MLPVAHENRQSHPLAPQLKVQVVPASQVCAQQGLHIAVQSDEQVDAASIDARSAPPPLATPPGSVGSNGLTAASGASSDASGRPAKLKLHAPATTTINHIQRIHL